MLNQSYCLSNSCLSLRCLTCSSNTFFGGDAAPTVMSKALSHRVVGHYLVCLVAAATGMLILVLLGFVRIQIFRLHRRDLMSLDLQPRHPPPKICGKEMNCIQTDEKQEKIPFGLNKEQHLPATNNKNNPSMHFQCRPVPAFRIAGVCRLPQAVTVKVTFWTSRHHRATMRQ